MRPPRLLYVTDPASCRWDVADVAAAAVEGGADAVQVRGARSDRELHDLALRIARAVRPAAAVIVNARFDVALAAGADGVHLKDDGLDARRVLQAALGAGAPPVFGVSVSTHDAAGLRRAAAEGATFATLGPLHDAPGKPGRGGAALAASLDEARAAGGLPPAVLLLGGVTSRDAILARSLRRGGERIGLAAIRWFQDAGSLKDVTARSREVAELLDEAGHCGC